VLLVDVPTASSQQRNI